MPLTKTNRLHIILLSLLVISYIGNSRLSIDFIIPYNTSVFKCIKDSGFSLVTLRAAFRQGLDPNGIQNLNNAKNAGLETECYITACRNRTASDLVNEAKTKVSGQLCKNWWVQIDTLTNDKNCMWINYNQNDNCVYMRSLVDQFSKNGIKAGILSTNSIWKQIFGDQKACQLSSSVPLWWISGDGKLNFENYQPMGGWNNPTRKQFRQQINVCGVTVNMNYQ